jgi:hypothetical protein
MPIYVLLWMCARPAWGGEFYSSLKARPKGNIMRRPIHADGYKHNVEEFEPAFDAIKPSKEGFDLATPADPIDCTVLYKSCHQYLGAFDEYV